MRSTPCAVAAILLAVATSTLGAQERTPFGVGAIELAPGQRSSGFLRIPDAVDEGSRWPW